MKWWRSLAVESSRRGELTYSSKKIDRQDTDGNGNGGASSIGRVCYAESRDNHISDRNDIKKKNRDSSNRTDHTR